jgi:hypothetical protein
MNVEAMCGTNAGWFRHYRANEPPCDPCRFAHNRVTAEHQSRRRRDSPEKRAADALLSKAQTRAQRRLAAAHPDEYRALIDEERVLLGLRPARRWNAGSRGVAT